MPSDAPHGRGTGANPRNRFVRLDVLPDPEVDPAESPAPATIFFRDTTRVAIATNDSPDIGFEASINPYRGASMGASIVMPGRFMNSWGSPPGWILKRGSW